MITTTVTTQKLSPNHTKTLKLPKLKSLLLLLLKHRSTRIWAGVNLPYFLEISAVGLFNQARAMAICLTKKGLQGYHNGSWSQNELLKLRIHLLHFEIFNWYLQSLHKSGSEQHHNQLMKWEVKNNEWAEYV